MALEIPEDFPAMQERYAAAAVKAFRDFIDAMNAASRVDLVIEYDIDQSVHMDGTSTHYGSVFVRKTLAGGRV